MKKKFKGIYSALILLLVACVAGSMVGCTGKKTEEAAGEKQVIKIFIPGYEDELWKGLYDAGINDFEKENQGVDVEVVPAGWDEANSKIVSLIQANEAPDVMITGSRSLRQFAAMGAIEKLDQYMTDEFKAGRVKPVLATANISGTQYGIPLAFSSRALYYRTDLIQTPPTTWDELYAAAEKVKKEHPEMYGFAIPTDITSGTDELFNFIYQNGGSATDADGNIKLATAENIATLEFLKKFSDNKLIPDPVSTSRSSQAPMFQNGDLAMFISGPWEQKTLDESADKAPYGVAVLPSGTKMAETLVTDSFSISSQSKNKELAWKLIEHMGKFEYQNAYDEAIGFFPILVEEEKEERYSSDFLKPFKEMIQYGVAEPQVPVWDTFNEQFVTAVQKVLTGNATAEDALKAAEAELTTK
ncbi:carbohydrate ABC transporter substrate-bindin g protein, CUT1 family (plasmid) [Peptoclostridium acidaminophilum DSM 3953]|uniref:Carbohydrate ABC transporter substrate-bindin g protein, CUT1 family n=1 Tax=Peptoclostridium acidaminophilum DSM 3953 TaxID=1286171 RepID=W8T853_PEPAC|nr:sugar ABC transporter substrate-binding protein [Peptoclostridium acidaminophilum]AHM57899.1 carbohydrate ABC transporter substrate-bindin g protein, CUT1 family [Peptoclostridium acidaminophilum DSM 3953]